MLAPPSPITSEPCRRLRWPHGDAELQALAKQFGGAVAPWGSWDAALQTPDVVVSSVSAEEPVLMRVTLIGPAGLDE